MTDAPFLPYGRQTIEEDDIEAVAAALRGELLTGGLSVKAFEEAFAARVGARHAVVCANGTAALHLAALALRLGEGDCAIVPSLTFLATANGPHYTGCDVVFADVDPATGLLTPATLAEALTRVPAGRTARAVFPVHLNGHCVDLAGIHAIAQAHGLAVIEDACHAVGGAYAVDGGMVPVGACRHSDMAVFSLHPVKTIAMGEGGVVTTNDDSLATRLRVMRNHGMSRDAAEFTQADEAFDAAGKANPWYYEMAEPGYNYRACDIQCALGLSQLGKLDRFLGRRRALAALYDRRLAPLAPLVRPVPRTPGCDSGWHLYVVHLDFAALGIDRAQVMARLHDDYQVGTQVHYLPVHRQPYWRKRTPALRLSGADAYYAGCLSLPLYPSLTEADVDRVVVALQSLTGNGPR